MTHKIKSEEIAQFKNQKSARKINTNIFPVNPAKSPSMGKLDKHMAEPIVHVTFDLTNEHCGLKGHKRIYQNSCD